MLSIQGKISQVAQRSGANLSRWAQLSGSRRSIDKTLNTAWLKNMAAKTTTFTIQYTPWSIPRSKLPTSTIKSIKKRVKRVSEFPNAWKPPQFAAGRIGSWPRRSSSSKLEKLSRCKLCLAVRSATYFQ